MNSVKERKLVIHNGGQAAVLGVIAMLILSLGLYTTYNIGRTVSEKIYLQNVADATAYSMAAVEARTFNFIAFANRCQVAHYAFLVSYQSLSPILQSYVLKYALYAYALDLLWTVLDHGALLRFAVMIYIGPLLRAIGRACNALKKVVKPLAQVCERVASVFRQLSKVLGALSSVIYPIVIMMNWIYWAASWAMSIGAFSILADDGYEAVTRRNDPTIKKHPVLGRVMGYLSAFRFNNVFDPVGGAPLPFTLDGFDAHFAAPKLLPTKNAQTKDDKSIKAAQVIMTEIVNATRQDNQAIDRGFLSGETAAVRRLKNIKNEAQSIASDAEGGGDDAADVLSGITDTLSFLNQLSLKHGQTKLVSQRKELSSKGDIQEALIDVKKTETDKSKFNRGTALSAVDYFGSGSGWAGRILNIGTYATVDKTYNCFFDGPLNKKNPLGKSQLLFAKWFNLFGEIEAGIRTVNLLDGGYIKCADTKDKSGDEKGKDYGAYPWRGIQPYMKFLPKSNDAEFNQPDTWVWLHRDFDDISLGENDLNFTFRAAGGSATFNGMHDAGIPGINVISRGQAYYHRPGAWKEHPNFFNPYWRARLAPIGDKLDKWLNKLPFEVNGTISKFLTDGIITH